MSLSGHQTEGVFLGTVSREDRDQVRQGIRKTKLAKDEPTTKRTSGLPSLFLGGIDDFEHPEYGQVSNPDELRRGTRSA